MNYNVSVSGLRRLHRVITYTGIYLLVKAWTHGKMRNYAIQPAHALPFDLKHPQ